MKKLKKYLKNHLIEKNYISILINLNFKEINHLFNQ